MRRKWLVAYFVDSTSSVRKTLEVWACAAIEAAKGAEEVIRLIEKDFCTVVGVVDLKEFEQDQDWLMGEEDVIDVEITPTA